MDVLAVVIVLIAAAGWALQRVIGNAKSPEALTAYWERHPQYAEALRQIYRRSTFVDEFGDHNDADWKKALRSFLADKAPELAGTTKAKDVSDSVLRSVEGSLVARWSAIPVSPSAARQRVEKPSRLRSEASNDGKEFEQRCAEVLRDAGWTVRHSGRAGDQGADLIASDNSIIAVVQCKNYSGSVSNSAVQQVAAARAFYDAEVALVVTDYGRFTKSARQLASKLDVLLLTISDFERYLRR